MFHTTLTKFTAELLIGVSIAMLSVACGAQDRIFKCDNEFGNGEGWANARKLSGQKCMEMSGGQSPHLIFRCGNQYKTSDDFELAARLRAEGCIQITGLQQSPSPPALPLAEQERLGVAFGRYMGSIVGVQEFNASKCGKLYPIQLRMPSILDVQANVLRRLPESERTKARTHFPEVETEIRTYFRRDFSKIVLEKCAASKEQYGQFFTSEQVKWIEFFGKY